MVVLWRIRIFLCLLKVEVAFLSNNSLYQFLGLFPMLAVFQKSTVPECDKLRQNISVYLLLTLPLPIQLCEDKRCCLNDLGPDLMIVLKWVEELSECIGRLFVNISHEVVVESYDEFEVFHLWKYSIVEVSVRDNHLAPLRIRVPRTVQNVDHFILDLLLYLVWDLSLGDVCVSNESL